MEYIRKCDVYPTIRCNCGNTCRIQEAEDQAKLEATEKETAKQKFIEDLIDFQFFLRDEGLINDEDWAYEDLAILFYNQIKAYESN
jgi:hypothetical protein